MEQTEPQAPVAMDTSSSSTTPFPMVDCVLRTVTKTNLSPLGFSVMYYCIDKKSIGLLMSVSSLAWTPINPLDVMSSELHHVATGPQHSYAFLKHSSILPSLRLLRLF